MAKSAGNEKTFVLAGVHVTQSDTHMDRDGNPRAEISVYGSNNPEDEASGVIGPFVSYNKASVESRRLAKNIGRECSFLEKRDGTLVFGGFIEGEESAD